MNNVYVLNVPMRRAGDRMVPSVNVGPAQEYGKLVFVFEGGASVFATRDMMLQIHEVLKNYDPENDYIVAIGDPSIIAGACAYIGKRNNKLRLLKWDRELSKYFPVEILV